jgi:hypothetical protein
MYDSAKDYLEALSAAPTVLEGLVADCTREQARAARGGDEGWSVVEVICHLRDAEERAVERARAMIVEDDPFLSAYDQEQWARDRAYGAADLGEALAAFSALRARHVALLQKLPVAGWDRPGRHEEQGGITIAAHALHMVSHDTIHAAQIARQLHQL